MFALLAPAGSTAELPGAEPYDAQLATRIRTALAQQGEGYVPRTRHLEDDGSPRFTNRLVFESSPYLRQHAHNPVNWYPWGEAAFDAARRLGRPVLLSIGYSTCHWCHVMEEESFEDLEIAGFLNAHYVAIKVDREERPDLDAIYMSAVQMISGRGGWPMTTWLTPDRKPFYGGTYFPARDGDRGVRTGFLTLLQRLAEAYREQPDGIAERAEELAGGIRRSLEGGGSGSGGAASWSMLDTAVQSLSRAFDAEWGGTLRAPKFPSTMPNRLLLRQADRLEDARALEMARTTLTRMAEGGIHDQVGGGFHRYSVDARWLVPHFEKMLYDNALLAVAYVEAFQYTGDASFGRVAMGILDYVEREMTSSTGGFYSATDADSATPHGETEEGRFFTWTPGELAALLDPSELSLVRAHYGVTDEGNFEGRSILHVARPLATVAEELGVSPEVAADALARASDKLYRARARRPPPLRDEKVLAAWNGLMISALARAGFVFDEPRYTRLAARAAEFVLGSMREDGRLLRSSIGGRARHNAYLDDYACMIAGLLDLFESRGEIRWFDEAVALQRVLDAHYADPDGGYFATSDDHETLLAREKPSGDGSEPSGNSVALMNLLRLHAWTGDDAYRARADASLSAFHGTLSRVPRALNEMLLAVDFRLSGAREIVLVYGDDARRAEPFLDVLRSGFHPRQVRVLLPEARVDDWSGRLPIVRGKRAGRAGVTAYVCREGVCALPTSDPKRFAEQLARARDDAQTSKKTGSNASEPIEPGRESR